MRRLATFSLQYDQLLKDLFSVGSMELNERTGHQVLAMGGTTLQVDLTSYNWLPLVGRRRTRPKTAAAELAWFLSGSRSAADLRRLGPKIWDKFVEGDGDTVRAAYGYRWRQHFGRDQLAEAVEALRKNPSDRRVFVSAWDPAEDGLGRPSKNVPCPVGFTLSQVGGELHSTLLIRSSDVFVGLPYDVMGHAMLMQLVAQSLQAHLGLMTVSVAHPHLYDSHFEMATTYLERPSHRPYVPFAPHTLEAATAHPEEFVLWYEQMAHAAADWPGWDPRPELVA